MCVCVCICSNINIKKNHFVFRAKKRYSNRHMILTLVCVYVYGGHMATKMYSSPSITEMSFISQPLYLFWITQNARRHRSDFVLLECFSVYCIHTYTHIIHHKCVWNRAFHSLYHHTSWYIHTETNTRIIYCKSWARNTIFGHF